ncbi:MAG: protein kinase [Myxococcota bacterium]|nr:protein kinase [Myxococcota bacterium]
MSSRETGRRFHFLREIATGGFGTVYLAKVMHPDGFSRLVAVKLLKAQWSDSEEVARRTRDEARLLGLLRHDHIVDVMDLTSIDGRAAVIMEYLEAVDLKVVVRHLEATGTVMPLRAALEAIAPCASALDAAYNRPPVPGERPLKVIHRDLKPSNVMVSPSGMVKVLDFGVARSEFDSRESHTREVQFGSVDYMSPERLFFEPETPASDVYSLGATLFEILALEKLGKAKPRPSVHADYVAERLEFMRGKLSQSGAAADSVVALVSESLSFAHEERPTAGQVYRRTRDLARSIQEDDLVQWSEVVIPGLVEKAQAAPRMPNPLTDSVLTEDSLLFSSVDVVTVNKDGSTTTFGESKEGTGEVLRRAALDGARLGTFEPSPATGAPAGSLDNLALIEASGSYHDETTVGADQPVPTAVPPEPDPPEDFEDEITEPGVGRTTLEEPLPPKLEVRPNLADNLSTRSGPMTQPFGVSELWTTENGVDPTATTRSLKEPEPTSEREEETRPARFHKGVERTSDAGQLPTRSLEAVQIPEVAIEVRDVSTSVRIERSLVGLLSMSLLFGLGSGVLAVGILLDLGPARDLLDSVLSDGPEAALVPAPRPLDVPVDDAPDQGLRFVSGDPGTRRLSVDCDGERVSGKVKVTVALEQADRCTVTLVRSDRTRVHDTLESAVSGTWRCFQGDSEACVREE